MKTAGLWLLKVRFTSLCPPNLCSTQTSEAIIVHKFLHEFKTNSAPEKFTVFYVSERMACI